MLKKLFGKKEEPMNPFIEFIKEHFKDRHNLIGLESDDTLSYDILNQLSIEKLYLISFSDYEPNDKIIYLEKTPSECINDIPSNLNFVYINDNTYDTLKNYFILYYPKLCKGGVISGNNFNASHLDIVKGIVELCRGYHLNLKGSENCWWIIKE